MITRASNIRAISSGFSLLASGRLSSVPTPEAASVALHAAQRVAHRPQRSRTHSMHSTTEQASSSTVTPVTNIESAAATAAEGATTAPPRPRGPRSNFCRMCGSKMELRVPEGEREERAVCDSCGYIDYFNPKMVVGCIVEHQGKILLCRRAIEPCKGLWTLPAGYLELHESSAEGAVRETREEAGCEVQVLGPYTHLDIPLIGQSYIIFRAVLQQPYTIDPGPESLEAALFAPEDIPFDQLAFSSVTITLQHYLRDLLSGTFHLHHGVIHKMPGSSPNDPGSYVLRDHFAVPTQLPAGGSGSSGSSS